MEALLLALRIVHILSGVFWAGTAFFLVLFLDPALPALGAQAGKFMQQLFLAGRLSLTLAVAGGFNVVCGLALYAIDSNGFQVTWMASNGGIALTIGGVLAIGAAITGGISGRVGRDMVAAGQSVAGGSSSAALATVAALQRRLVGLQRATAMLLLLAVISMAAWRYVG